MRFLLKFWELFNCIWLNIERKEFKITDMMVCTQAVDLLSTNDWGKPLVYTNIGYTKTVVLHDIFRI